MKIGTLLYKSKTSILKYFVPMVLFLTTIILYFISYTKNLTYIVPAVLSLLTLINAFNDTLTIYVYDNKFEFYYSNIFGNFLSIRHTYYFNEITYYNCYIKKADYSQQIELSILAFNTIANILPIRIGNSNHPKNPKAYIEIKKTNDVGETKDIELELEISNESQQYALDLIQKQFQFN